MRFFMSMWPCARRNTRLLQRAAGLVGGVDEHLKMWMLSVITLELFYIRNRTFRVHVQLLGTAAPNFQARFRWWLASRLVIKLLRARASWSKTGKLLARLVWAFIYFINAVCQFVAQPPFWIVLLNSLLGKTINCSDATWHLETTTSDKETHESSSQQNSQGTQLYFNIWNGDVGHSFIGDASWVDDCDWA